LRISATGIIIQKEPHFVKLFFLNFLKNFQSLNSLISPPKMPVF